MEACTQSVKAELVKARDKPGESEKGTRKENQAHIVGVRKGYVVIYTSLRMKRRYYMPVTSQIRCNEALKSSLTLICVMIHYYNL